MEKSKKTKQKTKHKTKVNPTRIRTSAKSQLEDKELEKLFKKVKTPPAVIREIKKP